MSNDNNIIKKLKNGMMLNCDTATLLITKSEFVKLGCMNRLQLQMHLASCKLCRRFKEQSKEISLKIKDFSNIEDTKITHRLSESQKDKLSQIIDNK